MRRPSPAAPAGRGRRRRRSRRPGSRRSGRPGAGRGPDRREPHRAPPGRAGAGTVGGCGAVRGGAVRGTVTPEVCLRPGGACPPGTAGRKTQITRSQWPRSPLPAPAPPYRRTMPEFHHTDVLPLGPDDTEYRRLDLPPGELVDVAARPHLPGDRPPATLTALVREAVHDIQHLLRPVAPGAAARDRRRPRGLGQRPVRRHRPAAQRLRRPPAGCCRCARTPAPRSSSASAPRPC